MARNCGLTNQKRLFEKHYAQELFRIAKGDFESALALNSSNLGRKENIVYMCQQAVEKSIKASLVHLQIPFPLIHDLGSLISLLPDDKMPPGGFSLIELNPYASVRRYEEGSLPLIAQEIEAAVLAATTVINWCSQVLEMKKT